jgi:hippurate hydrolase
MADRAVLTVGKMQAGSAANAIAGKAHLSGTFRTYGADTRDMIKRRIAEISEGVAHALGTSAGVRFGGGCPVLKNDGALCLALRGYCSEMLPPGAVCGTEALGGAAGGSEDFAYIAQKIPAAMLFVAAGANEYPLHHPRVCFDESAIAVGGAVYAHTALRWLSDRREGADCAER